MPMRKRRPIRIKIPGDPIPWKRPGQNKKDRYDEQKAQKHAVGLIARSLLNGSKFKPFKEAVCVSMEFLMPIPEYRERKITSKINDDETVWHTCVPDTDNLIKFYGDALNGILWTDDRIIASVLGEKYYSVETATIIEVSEL